MTRAAQVMAAAFAVVAFISCDSGKSTGPSIPSCGSVTGKGVRVTIGAADWKDTTVLSVDPAADSITFFYGVATLASPMQITNVNPGDTVTVQVVFADSLGIRATALPLVALSVNGGPGSGFTGLASYFALAQQGTWGLQTVNTGVYGMSAGVIDSYWLNAQATSPAAGSELYCFTSRFAVPSTLGNQAIADGQTIPVSSVSWRVALPGDMRAMPSPVVAR
jgi:hypothetical protein